MSDSQTQRTTSSGPSYYRLNPANLNDRIGPIPLTSPAEVDDMIERATRAAEEWSSQTMAARAQVLKRAAAIIRSKSEEIAGNITRESGKTISESRGEAAGAAGLLEFFASGAMWADAGKLYQSPSPHSLTYTVYQPIGTVGVITPWNAPLSNPTLKIAPALLAGNSVIWKPSPWTPGAAHALKDSLCEAGLSPDLIGVALDESAEAAKQIVADQRIGAVTFTGSSAVGAEVAAAVTARGGKVQCEMGGKNVLVVMEDADLDQAAAAAVGAAFTFAGQKCGATSRLLVHASVKRAFTEKLIARIQGLKIGDPTQKETDIGPIVHERQLKQHLNAIQQAQDDGSSLIYGGRRLDEGTFADGLYLQPAVFDGVQPAQQLGQDELFGPILGIIPFSDFEEALRITNGTKYGLVSSIYTQNLARAFDFVARAQTGTVKVNQPTTGMAANVPIGGWKASSVGPKELGPRSLEFFMQEKTVWLNHA